jgi:HEAT repeat protein
MRRYRALFIASLVVSLMSSLAFAGRGGSTAKLESAVRSGSVDTIVAEIERAEFLACLSCIEPVRALVDHPSEKVREAAGWWLGRRGVRKEILSDMTARLAGQDPVAARNAGDVLRGMRDSSALPALAAYVSKPLDEESGVSVVRAIGAIGAPSSLLVLKTGMSGSLTGMRVASLKAVRELRAEVGKRAVTDGLALLPLLSDTSAEVRREAILSIGHVGQQGIGKSWSNLADVVSTLSQLCTSDSSARVRKAAAWALGELGDGGGRAALAAAQNDADPLVRSVANAAANRLR